VLSWELSNTLEAGFCLTALNAAFRFGQPEVWNSDQGSQFTSSEFLAPLQQRGILISMDGRGRALDNVFERLWRSLKYELIYPGDFATGLDLFPALQSYFHFYNYQRPQTPWIYRWYYQNEYFPFTQMAACRKLEMLARGLRGGRDPSTNASPEWKGGINAALP
jgi:putative transposase